MVVWDEAAGTIVDQACETTPPATVLYGPADLGVTTSVNLVGDPTQGAQGGEQSLAASATQTLCFQVSLPTSTGNTFEGLTSTAAFAFDAEQTANNA